jgi:hypothetical protein
LCKACYLMRVIKPIMPIETLKVVYYSYFHSLLTYGIIFWGNSSYSLQIFRIQKRVIRIMNGLRPRDSCTDTFRVLRILPLHSQYIFSLLTFVVNNKSLYHTTSQIHGVNTRRNFDLYCPQSNLTTYQRGPYYFGIKLFNHLPLNIKELAHNIKQFRAALIALLHSKSFYTLEEYSISARDSSLDSHEYIVIFYFIVMYIYFNILYYVLYIFCKCYVGISNA